MPPSMASGPVLATFWDLAAVDEGKRLTAAATLVTLLTEEQAKEGDATPCGDLTYAVRRLVRGLASSRDGARQGFGAALIEVLRTFEAVDLTTVLSVMEESMALHGSMHGAEERDALFGRIFTCASVLRSGRLASLPSGRCASLAASISKELAYCANKKSFLQELCATLQCTLIDTLPIDQVQSAVWPNISPLLTVPLAEWSAHALLLAFRLCRKLPPATLTALLPHVSLHKGQLLSLTNLPALVGPLKTASVAHPRLHAVWDDILDHGLTPAPPRPPPPPPPRRRRLRSGRRRGLPEQEG